MFIGPCIIVIVEEWKTNLMSLAILFHFLCAQLVSDINISIFRSLRLCWWITTSVVLFSFRCVLEFWCGWFWVVFVLQAEAQLVLQPATRKRYGGIALLFHNSGTRRGEWSAARPGRTLPPGKTQYPFYRRLGGPQGRSGRAENLVPTGIRSRTVQPVVSRCTCSYSAHVQLHMRFLSTILYKFLLPIFRRIGKIATSDY